MLSPSILTSESDVFHSIPVLSNFETFPMAYFKIKLKAMTIKHLLISD
jgi:hypothetical protein